MRLAHAFLLACCVLLARGYDPETARPMLLVNREFSTDFLAVGEFLPITFNVANTGERVALKAEISLKLPDGWTELFEVSGALPFHLERLEVGEKAAHIVQLRAKRMPQYHEEELYKAVVGAPVHAEYKDNRGKSYVVQSHMRSSSRLPYVVAQRTYFQMLYGNFEVWATFVFVMAMLTAVPLWAVWGIRARYPAPRPTYAMAGNEQHATKKSQSSAKEGSSEEDGRATARFIAQAKRRPPKA